MAAVLFVTFIFHEECGSPGLASEELLHEGRFVTVMPAGGGAAGESKDDGKGGRKWNVE